MTKSDSNRGSESTKSGRISGPILWMALVSAILAVASIVISVGITLSEKEKNEALRKEIAEQKNQITWFVGEVERLKAELKPIKDSFETRRHY